MEYADEDERLLHGIFVYLVSNAMNNKFILNLGRNHDPSNWENLRSIFFRSLFEGGPAKAITGAGCIRHFQRENEWKDIYIYVSREHGLGGNISTQMFGIGVHDRQVGRDINVIARGALGVLHTLNELFRDEYEVVFERFLAHNDHMQDFENYLGRLDVANNIPFYRVIEYNR